MACVPLHDLVKRNSSVARTVPPAPEGQILWESGSKITMRYVLGYLEPILEWEPSKSINDQFPLAKVSSLMNGREMTGD